MCGKKPNMQTYLMYKARNVDTAVKPLVVKMNKDCIVIIGHCIFPKPKFDIHCKQGQAWEICRDLNERFKRKKMIPESRTRKRC